MSACTRCQHRAGQHRLFVHKYGAQTAVCGLAAALDAQAAMISNKVDEQRVRRHIVCYFLSIQCHCDQHIRSPLLCIERVCRAAHQHTREVSAIFRTAAQTAAGLDFRPNGFRHLLACTPAAILEIGFNAMLSTPLSLSSVIMCFYYMPANLFLQVLT